MAIHHVQSSTGTRTGGQSAAAKSDYILRDGKYAGDAAEVLYYDFDNMPAWAEDNPRAYWLAADTHERANGRLYKEIEFALPHECDDEQCIRLVREVIAEAMRAAPDPAQEDAPRASELLPYTWAIHCGGLDKDGRDHNRHVHIMLSERGLDGFDRSPETWFRRYNGKDPAAGGAKKTRILKPRAWLGHLRAYVAERINHYLPDGVDRVDHRSYADQGVDKIPQIHLGPYAHRLLTGQEVRGKDTPDYTRVERYEHIENLRLDLESHVTDWSLVDKDDVRASRQALADEAATEVKPDRLLKVLDYHETLTDYLRGRFNLEEAYDRIEFEERDLDGRDRQGDRLAPPEEREQKQEQEYRPPRDDRGGGWKYL